ncbi:glycosyltransferase [Burkholderia vietnamiensis]|uniref:glycosyltransferase n=1 Tax=Burkholderia TaxID=32008 RepID=UPI0005A08160|nr:MULTISPECIES: glycosyltransferase [Burkholderia]KVF73592.1 glycosyl transferase family 1 [Burkholderia vietnamiensis]KVF86713.1 glycosyl transferase family 1 [Burkholderia vietnamiensis]KVF92893.1 glycosyl transferase family 1 [Burkholderia vietnamiensis]KVG04766.1 glycosyl transferase family 1 [Burkholderia vietnamiensis]MBR8053808.1 glycosyltransferase [Burkholderia vietnamiensis]
MKCEDIVLLSTADWDNPFWTNKQHVAVELARRGHRVLYVDSIGLRQPSATTGDMRRIVRRLVKSAKGLRQVQERIWVWSPVAIPMHQYSVVRRLNRMLLSFGLAMCSTYLGFKRPICWTYNPLTTRFFDLSRFEKLVYHCVDEVKAQPGVPYDIVEVAEMELTQSCQICFVTSEHLLETRKAWKQQTYYFPNVADYAHFGSAMDRELKVPSDLEAIPGPRIGFIGAISGYKVDFELLARMAHEHPEWSIVLIGRVGEGDPSTTVSQVEALPNVHLLGARSYESLPAYLKGIDVAILPSRLNEYTRGMFPMKFFEYLAAGKPVVATDLHALAGFADVCTLANDHASFVAGVERALSDSTEKLHARLSLAQEYTYERRTSRMMELVNSLGA